MNNSKIINALIFGLLALLSISALLPFVWMLSTSLKDNYAVFVYPPEWVPNPVTFEAYRKIFTLVPFGRQLLNSVTVSVSVTLGQLFFCSLAAFSFSRLEYPGRDVIFVLYLATLMVPHYVTLIPGYILMNKLRWINTLKALIIPRFFGAAYGTFLLRQFFMTIPYDLQDAAVIDGCSSFRIYAQIMLPLIKPALATLGLFTFMGNWNDFFWPLIVTNSEEVKTLIVSLATLSRSYYSTDWPTMMAGATVSLLPMLVLFGFAQKYFVEGVVLTGIK